MAVMAYDASNSTVQKLTYFPDIFKLYIVAGDIACNFHPKAV